MGPLLEWFADLFAVTNRGRRMSFFVAVCMVFALVAVLLMRGILVGGLARWVFVVLLLFAPLAALHVMLARNRLRRSAYLSLNDPRQRPVSHGPLDFAAPTAVALSNLALAVDAVRRGHAAEANDLLPRIDRRLLRREEIDLLEATRAMISLNLGDRHRAAIEAVNVLPTGCTEIDVALGRAILAEAWNNPTRLSKVDLSWEEAGVDGDGQDVLSPLRRLVRVRLGTTNLEDLSAAEARALAEEAQAMGDQELWAELEARARGSLGLYR